MKTPSLPQIAAALFCFCVANLAMALDDKDSVVTAVFSRSFNNYERPVRADGSPAIQTYVVAKGGYAPSMSADPSMDDVKFAGIVRVLGKYLAKQGYYPAKDAKKADLMLVVHWGKTVPFNGAIHRNMLDDGLRGFETLQQMGEGIGRAPGEFRPDDGGVPPSAATFGEKEARKQEEAAIKEAGREELVQGLMEIRTAQDMRIADDEYNANLLGYTAELKRRDNPSLYGGAGTAYHDLIADIESERYYVSLTAYDFQALQRKEKKGLWRTVTSIDAHGNRFDEKLTAMIDKASRYFGRDSERLVREFDYVPHVNFGDLKVLGVIDHAPDAK